MLSSTGNSSENQQSLVNEILYVDELLERLQERSRDFGGRGGLKLTLYRDTSGRRFLMMLFTKGDSGTAVSTDVKEISALKEWSSRAEDVISGMARRGNLAFKEITSEEMNSAETCAQTIFDLLKIKVKS